MGGVSEEVSEGVSEQRVKSVSKGGRGLSILCSHSHSTRLSHRCWLTWLLASRRLGC